MKYMGSCPLNRKTIGIESFGIQERTTTTIGIESFGIQARTTTTTGWLSSTWLLSTTLSLSLPEASSGTWTTGQLVSSLYAVRIFANTVQVVKPADSNLSNAAS
jgi:hypothetical protein